MMKSVSFGASLQTQYDRKAGAYKTVIWADKGDESTTIINALIRVGVFSSQALEGDNVRLSQFKDGTKKDSPDTTITVLKGVLEKLQSAGSIERFEDYSYTPPKVNENETDWQTSFWNRSRRYYF